MSPTISEGSQGRNLESGTEGDALEEAYLLAPPGLFSLLTYTPQDRLLRGGTATVSWALLRQSSIKTMP